MSQSINYINRLQITKGTIHLPKSLKTNPQAAKMLKLRIENVRNVVVWGVVCCSLCDKHLCLSIQSKKHANKVRRYLSMQNEKEPVFKKLKLSSSDQVSEKCLVLS